MSPGVLAGVLAGSRYLFRRGRQCVLPCFYPSNVAFYLHGSASKFKERRAKSQSSPGAYEKEVTLHACRIYVFAPGFEAAQNVAARGMDLEHQVAQQAQQLAEVQWLERRHRTGGCLRIRPDATPNGVLELHCRDSDDFEDAVKFRITGWWHEKSFWHPLTGASDRFAMSASLPAFDIELNWEIYEGIRRRIQDASGLASSSASKPFI